MSGVRNLRNGGNVDQATNAQLAMEYEHHEIHAGNHYYVCGVLEMTNGQVVDFTAITPDTGEWCHSIFEVEGSGAVSIQLYEGATVDTEGTTVTPINNNRNSTNTSNSIVRAGDTFTDEGTLIYHTQSGANKVTGKLSRAREIILKANTTYIYRITNETVLANAVSYCAEWYVHTNLN